MVLGKTDADLFSPEDVARLAEIKQGVLESGEAAREQVSVTIDGETIFYDLVVEPVRDSEGEIAGVASVSLDVTASKRAEETLNRTGAVSGHLAPGPGRDERREPSRTEPGPVAKMRPASC